MADIVQPGTPAPAFTLKDELGEDFTNASIAGQTAVFVFFPFAFSPVCTDQFQVYEEVLDEFQAQGATLYGVSCDSMWSLKAFKEKLGVSIAMLSDFEPKGAMSKAFGAYFEPAGFSDRSLVIVGPDLVVRWSHTADSPGEVPGVNLIVDALAASASQ